MVGQRPVAKFTAGQVAAAVWKSEMTRKAGKKVTMLKATVERRYKDRDGQWKSSSSFSRNEIPFAIHCLQKSFDYIIAAQQEQDGILEEEIVD